MTDSTPVQVGEYQKALNAWTQHHCPDLLGPVEVDSQLGDVSTKRGLRAARYLGVGLPTVREWAKDFNAEVVAKLTDWFRHPSHFYMTHPLALAAGKTLMAQERAKRTPVENTPFQVREYQRALNAWTQHHCHDLLGAVRVDSVLGDSSTKVGLRAARYLGVGHATVAEWAKDFNPEIVANLTDWFRHPSHFYKTHPLALAAGKKLMAQERAKRVVRPKGDVIKFDTAFIADWIHPILVEARNRGWTGTIPDGEFGGFRTRAKQTFLFHHDPPPVASPDLPSNHQLKKWPGGAVDCSENDQLDRILQDMGSDLGRQGDAASSDPVHFSSARHFRDTGHF